MACKLPGLPTAAGSRMDQPGAGADIYKFLAENNCMNFWMFLLQIGIGRNEFFKRMGIPPALQVFFL